MFKIFLKKGQQIYFTSDTHYNHKNICRGTTDWKDADDVTRDFNTLEEMNKVLIDNINAVVGEDDILIHVGDWSFGGFDKIAEFRNQLNCKNIHIVLGNHDHHIENNKDNVQSLFSSVHKHMELDLRMEENLLGTKRVLKFKFDIFHYPIASWKDMNQGIIHLHGHVHLSKNKKVGQGRSLDIGVEGNDLRPYSLANILGLMNNQPIDKLCLPKDHHVKRLE